MKAKEILWKDIKVGDIMLDGSVVTQIHATHTINCIRIRTLTEDICVSEDHLFLCDISKIRRKYRKRILHDCIGKIPLEVDYVIFSPNTFISDADKEKLFRSIEDGTIEEKYDVQEFIVKDESKIYDIKKNLVWLTALEIHRIMLTSPGKISSGGNIILSCEFVGEKDAFCISTDTGRYITGMGNSKSWKNNIKINNRINSIMELKSQSNENDFMHVLVNRKRGIVKSYKNTYIGLSDEELENMSCRELLNELDNISKRVNDKNTSLNMQENMDNVNNYDEKSFDYSLEYSSGMIHHNSVTIRNIIFHCLTHGIKIGLVDLKITEFEEYKGHANVIGVANDVNEACELLRICRQLMYKRNKELAKAGVVDIIDYKPHRKTDRISVFGREYGENDKLMFRSSEGEEKEITFLDLENMIYKKGNI